MLSHVIQVSFNFSFLVWDKKDTTKIRFPVVCGMDLDGTYYQNIYSSMLPDKTITNADQGVKIADDDK